MIKKMDSCWLRSIYDLKVFVLSCSVLTCLVVLTESVTGQQATGVEKHSGHGNHGHQPATGKGEKTTGLVLPDVEVQDQNGRKLKFYSELVKGRKVVINFIYTSCKAVCPMSGDHFAKLQKTLGDKLGRDVFLISVTTDPEVDSPDRLKTWSKRFNPSPGWTLVTGSRKEISSLLLVLTGDGTQTGYHVPAICLIDDLKKSHRWTYGLSDPAEIMRMII